MALVACKECGAKVSTEAKACPQCGAKPPQRTSLTTWLVAGVVGLVAVQCTLNSSERDRARADSAATEAKRVAALSPAQREAEEAARRAQEERKAREEIEFQYAVAATKMLKASMKNPDSFELTNLFRVDDGTLCYEYRATNSFNAVTSNYAVVPAKGKTVAGAGRDVAAQWNRHCADKPGRDLTFVRRAL